MDLKTTTLQKHREWAGKLEVTPRASVDTKEALSIAYTPGVAEPCLEIQRDPALSYTYTRRWNTVAVVTDGTAVLGLGDIGPEAAMPVMEGKCLLFKEFADIDAFPLCIRSKDTDEIVRTVEMLCGGFGGINLEDISAPRCFEIEKRLKQVCDIPVFHDDQHGTAVVTLAGLKNAMKIVNKKTEDVKAVISGAGAAGVAIAKLLTRAGFGNIVLCNRKGAVCKLDTQPNGVLAEMAGMLNPENLRGGLSDVVSGADNFVGVSAAGLLTPDMVRKMARDPIVFAMANPEPEIMPDTAKAAGARIVATGRSDFPNQINNVLAFPGIFRGALDARVRQITEEMCLAAACALAVLVAENELREEHIIPSPFDRRAVAAVAAAVCGGETGI